MIELPLRDPCDLCEGMAGREERWAIVDEGEYTLTVVNPWQFEVGQCRVITRRHVALLLDLSDQECAAVLVAARRVADALDRTYRPLGILHVPEQRCLQRTVNATLPFSCRAPAGGERLGYRSAATRDVRGRRAPERYRTRSSRGCAASGACSGACQKDGRNCFPDSFESAGTAGSLIASLGPGIHPCNALVCVPKLAGKTAQAPLEKTAT